MNSPAIDVLVVGFGIAGLSAAVTAHQTGARVTVLERAPMEERGGNTRYTESFWRMKNADQVSDDFEDRFAANAGGWPDPGILRDLVRDRENQPAVLRSLGTVDPSLIATIAQIVEATGWQPHTVRGAISGALKKKLGLNVVSEKIDERGRVYKIIS